MSRLRSGIADWWSFFTIKGTLIAVACIAYGVIGLWFLPGGNEPPQPVKDLKCWNIPAKYHGGRFCSDELEGGVHGYVNPGSMEWEVE